jgi:hypothetical protein
MASHGSSCGDAFAPLRAVPKGKGVVLPKPLSLAGHDHIIGGKDGHASLKGLRLI